MSFKSGFVNIIGNPNVGKSTLMNELVGEQLSVVNPKAQTTRHRILGIVNGEDFQAVFSDTPGIVKPAYKLHEAMMRFVKTAFSDADIILYVTDVIEKSDKNASYTERIQKTDTPVIIAINKCDLINEAALEIIENQWKELVPNATVIRTSALLKYNLDILFSKILELLPEGPAYYPTDALTDKPERYFVSEIIRGHIFNNYRKEVPYSTEVIIDSFKEDPDIVRINALINVARESQKGILIGHKGESLKKTGTLARLDIEKFLGKKVYLGLSVKVAPNWRDNERLLKNFGY